MHQQGEGLRLELGDVDEPLLLRAVFAAAVGIVEPLVTRMVQLVLYETAPGSYTSLADPELDKKARGMCYGSPAKWREALVDSLGITVLADLVDWADLGLLWEARNVIAHRGGVADSRYHQQVGAQIGSILASEPSSVRAAIDQIGAARYAIVAGVWDHLTPGMGARDRRVGAHAALEQLAGRPPEASPWPRQSRGGLRSGRGGHRHREG